MGKIVKNNLANFLVILLIFVLAIGWIFSGWPRIWQNPPVPLEVKEVKANPDTEIKKPTTSTSDLGTVFTSPENAYDLPDTGGDESTNAVQSNAVTSIYRWHTWATKGQTYTATVLKVNWNTSGGFLDDHFAIEATKDGTNWNLVLVADGVHNETAVQTAQVLLDTDQDLTQVQVRVNFVKVGGGDKDSLYIYDIWTEGTYTPPVNDPPAFDSGYEPWENPESNDTTPTDMDANVTFKATATDPESNGWYLAICKGEGITPGASGAAPTCNSGTWVISTSSSGSGTEITETYTITSGETLESYAWYAYACDDDSGGAACTATYSNSGRTDTGGTPFSVNHRPSFTAVSDNSPQNPGGTVRVTADTYTETDTGDTVSLYVCTTAAFTGGGSPACDVSQWCNVTGITPGNPLYCDLAVPNPAAHGTNVQNYYPYVVDNHGLVAEAGKQGSAEAYDVSDVVPTISGTPSLNSGSAIDLSVGGEKSTTDIYVTGTISDDNGCSDIVVANVTADVWQTTLVGRTGCDAAGEADDNKCYPDVTCIYDSATEACGAMPDKTGGYKCTVSFQYYANPTDDNTPWVDDDWTATLIPGDELGQNDAGEANSTVVELQSFLALGLASEYDAIAYEANAGGDMDPGTYNDPLLDKTWVEATGNCALDVTLYGTTMTGPGTAIPIGNQRYASGSEAPAWADGTALIADPGEELELNVLKTNSVTISYGKLWWGIEIPSIQTAGGYSGTNTITAVKAEVADW